MDRTRRIGEEAAGKAYLAVQHVVTIGLPRIFRETATELTGKLQLQGESIEGLRAMNEKVVSQMAKMQEQNEALQARLQQIEQTAEEQRAAMDKLNSLAPVLTSKQLADIAKIVAQKRGPGKKTSKAQRQY